MNNRIKKKKDKLALINSKKIKIIKDNEGLEENFTTCKCGIFHKCRCGENCFN